MSIHTKHGYVTHGTAILRRLDALPAPGPVVSLWRDKFRAVHAGLEVGDTAVAVTFKARHDAYAAVARCEHEVEIALAPVLDRLPAAGIGDRRNPLRDLSEHLPGELHELGHQRLADEVATIVANARPRAAKKKILLGLLDALAAKADALTASLTPVIDAEERHHEAVRHRDGTLLEWTSTLAKLRRRVEVHFEDAPDDAAAIFAPPVGVEAAHHADASPEARSARKQSAAEKKAAKAAGRAAEKASLDAAHAEERTAKAARKAAKAAAKDAAKSAEAAARKAKKKAKGRVSA